MDGWIDGWMDEWMDGLMDASVCMVLYLHECMGTTTCGELVLTVYKHSQLCAHIETVMLN